MTPIPGPSPHAWGLPRWCHRPPEQPGPSPHAWGLRTDSIRKVGESRAIPTCVGTTRAVEAYTESYLGHPHMRGDYAWTCPRDRRACGPSPHAWGLLRMKEVRNAAERAIPTCVGTTGEGAQPGRAGAGHPHMRGDYQGGRSLQGEVCGPSPHAWGLRPTSVSITRWLRAIPTCVGTTSGPSPPLMA